MDDLIAFVTARLDEDEAAAKGCSLENWKASGPMPSSGYIGPADWYLVGRVNAHEGKLLATGLDIHDPEHRCLIHAARHDPARVLREVEAKRAIVGWHVPVKDCEPPQCIICLEYVPCRTLSALAAVYSGHPDYRQEWKP